MAQPGAQQGVAAAKAPSGLVRVPHTASTARDRQVRAMGDTGMDEDGLVLAEEIGRGGFAVVHRAHDTDFGRDVAVKVLQARLDNTGLARFERECAAVGAISHHPHIVAVHRSGATADGKAYLVMELLPGGSLAARAPLAWPEATGLGVALAGALETAHRAGVLHRDVKPENVLFSAFGAPVLVDFGIAAVRGGYETRSSAITASLAHAAPEVVAGARATVASDVYALASTLFFALAGRAPFTEESDETLIPMIARIATAAPPDLRAHGVPDEVASVVAAALAKDTAQRPLTAEEFAEALRTAAAASGVDLPPIVVPDGSGAFADGGEGMDTRVVARRSAAPAPVAPVRSRRRRVLAGAAGLAVLVGGTAYALGDGDARTPVAVRPVAQVAETASPTPVPAAAAPAPAETSAAPATGPGAAGAGPGTAGDGPGTAGAGSGTAGAGSGAMGAGSGATGAGPGTTGAGPGTTGAGSGAAPVAIGQQRPVSAPVQETSTVAATTGTAPRPVVAPPVAQNHAPSLAALAGRQNDELSAGSLHVSGSDPDGDALTYTASGLPAGLSMSSSGTVTGTVSPDASSVTADRRQGLRSQAFSVTVRVSDGKATDSGTFTWTIRDTHRVMPDYYGHYGCDHDGSCREPVPNVAALSTPGFLCTTAGSLPAGTIAAQSVAAGAVVRWGQPVTYTYKQASC